MATEFHLQVQEVLEALVGAEPEERERLIQRACAGSPRLLREVRSLLPHYEAVRAFEPERPGGSEWKMPGTTTCAQMGAEVAADEAAEREQTPPFCIDQYRVLEVLGRGGMGVVYRAVHATLRRPFAIKVLREGLVSPEDRWRFAFEAQILRRLQHPGIARLLHANEIKTARGTQPYFVMEYIQGDALTKYANLNQLGTRQRLELFVKVCAAVDYAHRRGVIHRDLKPANILVERGGQPKILDFGVARLAEFQSAFLGDEDGHFIGTREYASPEQARGETEQLTPRSDVYSLGIVAHELLTGRLPRRVDGKLRLTLGGVGLDDTSKRPIANQKEFRYYLTAILRTALAHSPDRRQSSAGELGADIESLLALYPAASGWSALKSRLARFLSPQSEWAPSPASRPLGAVLRKRIAMAIDSESYTPPPPDEPADAADPPLE